MSLFKLNSVSQARWARFCQNRRGYWSLWIFMVMLILVLIFRRRHRA